MNELFYGLSIAFGAFIIDCCWIIPLWCWMNEVTWDDIKILFKH